MIDLVKEFFNLTWKYWVMFLLLSAAVQAAWYYLKPSVPLWLRVCSGFFVIASRVWR